MQAFTPGSWLAVNPTPVMAAALVCRAGAVEPVAAAHQRRLHGWTRVAKETVRRGIAGIEKSGLNGGSLAFALMTLTGSPKPETVGAA